MCYRTFLRVNKDASACPLFCLHVCLFVYFCAIIQVTRFYLRLLLMWFCFQANFTFFPLTPWAPLMMVAKCIASLILQGKFHWWSKQQQQAHLWSKQTNKQTRISWSCFGTKSRKLLLRFQPICHTYSSNIERHKSSWIYPPLTHVSDNLRKCWRSSFILASGNQQDNIFKAKRYLWRHCQWDDCIKDSVETRWNFRWKDCVRRIMKREFKRKFISDESESK